MSAAATLWILKLKDEITAPLKGIDGTSRASAMNVLAVAESVRRLQDEFNKFIVPGVKFENSLADVEAITGVTGEALEKLGVKARKSAKEFGGEASGSLENYKVILSRLGPELAQNQEALDNMNRYALTLSKTMGNDVNGAIDALTTSMLQFRTDLSDPIAAAAEMEKMMNIIAAGAQYGSAEVPAISAAIQNAGVAASQANVSFSETNAALQELARGGKEGAEGGIALRNVLGKMAGADVIPKEALEKLQRYGVDMKVVSDTTLPFTTRLRELAKAQADGTALAQVFGVENAAAAAILVRSVDAQDELRSKIENTSTAYEMAGVKMDTYSEKMKRMRAWVDDFKISIFNITKEFAPYINMGMNGVQMLAYLKNAKEGVAMIMNTKFVTAIKSTVGGFRDLIKNGRTFIMQLATMGLNLVKTGLRFGINAVLGIWRFIASLNTATIAQWALNVAMNANPIGLIVLGIAAVIAAIVLVVKYWDTIKAAIARFASWILKNNPFAWLINIIEKIFPGFKAKLGALWEWVKNLFLKAWERIKAIWNAIKKFFGFGDDKKATIEVDVVEKDKKKKPAKKEAEKDGLFAAATPSGNGGETTTTTGGTTSPNGSAAGGSGKTIQMTLNIQNHFTATGERGRNNIEELADQFIGRIVDRLRDSVIALEA